MENCDYTDSTDILNRIKKLSGELEHSRMLQQHLHPKAYTSLMIIITILAFLTTSPGLALYFSGKVKIKHILTTYIQCVCMFVTVTLYWLIFGYSIAFSPSSERNQGSVSFIGDSSQFWLKNISLTSFHFLAPTLPESIFCLYQLAHAINACTWNIGGFAARSKFQSMLLFSFIWLLVVYCPLVHSLKHPYGFLFSEGIIDHGALTTHLSSGVSSVLASYFIGPQLVTKDYFESRNIFVSLWGSCFVYTGTMALNIGSSLSCESSAISSLLNTIMATSGSAAMWTTLQIITTGKVGVLGSSKGVIAGVIAISAGCRSVTAASAFDMGMITGLICYCVNEWTVKQKRYLIDDLDVACIINMVSAICGSFLVGLFFDRDMHQYDQYPHSVHTKIAYQILAQLKGIFYTIAYAGFLSIIILKCVDYTVGLRSSEEYESVGLDLALLNETIVSMPKRQSDALYKKVNASVESKIDEELDSRMDIYGSKINVGKFVEEKSFEDSVFSIVN